MKWEQLREGDVVYWLLIDPKDLRFEPEPLQIIDVDYLNTKITVEKQGVFEFEKDEFFTKSAATIYSDTSAIIVATTISELLHELANFLDEAS